MEILDEKIISNKTNDMDKSLMVKLLIYYRF